jgi:hypothetical protein
MRLARAMEPEAWAEHDRRRGPRKRLTYGDIWKIQASMSNAARVLDVLAELGLVANKRKKK